MEVQSLNHWTARKVPEAPSLSTPSRRSSAWPRAVPGWTPLPVARDRAFGQEPSDSERQSRISLDQTIAQLVKNMPTKKKKKESSYNAGDPSSIPGSQRSPGKGLPTPVFLGFLCGSAGKESACNVGDLGLIPGLGISPGKGKGYPLQCSDLENSMDCIVHGVAKSRT